MEIGKEASAPASASAWGATLIRLPVATRQNQILIPNQTGDGQHCEDCDDSLLCLPNLELFNLRRDCRLCLLLLCPSSSAPSSASTLQFCFCCGFCCFCLCCLCRTRLSPVACKRHQHVRIALCVAFFIGHLLLLFPSSSCFSFFPLGKLCSVCFSRGSSRWQRLSPRGQWPVPVGVEHVFCSSSGGLFVPLPPSLLFFLLSFVLLNRK